MIGLQLASFGRHVQSLRAARGLTQEDLAERSDVAPDTIRRIEHDDCSPGLDTITKLAGGLDLRLSTVFEGYELGEQAIARELVDLLAGQSPPDIQLAVKLLRVVFAELAAARHDDTCGQQD